MLRHIRDPRPCGVDERASSDNLAPAPRIEHELPVAALAVGPDQPGASADGRAAFGRIDRVEYDEAGIIDPAVRIDEALAERPLERFPYRVMGEIDRLS